MKRFCKIAILLMGCLGGCGSSSEKIKNVELIPPSQRQPASEIKAYFFNAPNNLTLAQMKGKLLLVDYWATWCGPCRMEIPTLLKMYDTYHSRGLELWGLSVEANDGKSNDYFNQFISQNQIQYPIGLASNETLKNYGINPIPTTFFIDPNGKIALSFVGVHSEEDFIGAIEKILAE